MRTNAAEHIEPAVLTIQGLLGKIDRLRPPAASRRDVECILVRQVSRELDHALPWQAGHGTGTAVIADRIGRSLGLGASALHDLTLAALLHDIGLLMLPPELRRGGKAHDPASYVAIQNHSRLGANPSWSPSRFCAMRRSSLRTTTNGGTARVIPTALGEVSFRSAPEFWPWPTHSRRFRFPRRRIVACATTSR